MNWERSKLLIAAGRMGFFARAALLTLGLLIPMAAIAPVAYYSDGPIGVMAAVAAALACLFGGLAALMVSHWLQGPTAALYAMLLGMLLRTGVPLAIGAAIHLGSSALARAGLIYYLLAFYVVALMIETFLTVSHVQRETNSPEGL